MHYHGILVSTLAMALFTATASASTTFSSDFESGNIGTVTPYTNNAFDLALRDDNDNPNLPDNWRSWWYVKAHSAEAGQTLQLSISNRGWPYFSVPAYSYDQKLWRRMDERMVTQSTECDMGIEACILSFEHTNKYQDVYFSPFLPYPTSQLEHFIDRIISEESVTVETLGYSQHFQLPIYHITITDPHSKKQKARVWIHARSHPGETPSNFVLEGFINFLISGHPVAKRLRDDLIFHIVPIHNADGVFAGNYRSNTASVNFENTWFFDKDNPGLLTSEAPNETRLLNSLMHRLLNDRIPVKMALNLHASNSEPDTAVFAFPHFGDDRSTYSRKERDLWDNQLRFIDYLTRLYEHRVELPPEDGGNGFLNSFYPETWWWFNAENKVLALTIALTYGKAGYDHWITDVEQRDFGIALANAIGVYFTLDEMPTLPARRENRVRKDSIIYSPGFEDILKGSKID